MAASANATRVYWGTAWTSRTLLAREKRAALEAERIDGRRRVFNLTADEVGLEVPAYQRYVNGEIARLGRGNPIVLTQYLSAEIDAQAGMFPPERIALMAGVHAAMEGPSPREGRIFAFLIDIAGEDESKGDLLYGSAVQMALPFGVGIDDDFGAGESIMSIPMRNAGRDATALTVVWVDLYRLDTLRPPIFRVVHRYAWTGVPHTALYAQINAYAEAWSPAYIVCDATGVGAGLTSFLQQIYRRCVLPFHFNQSTKSKLGWDFIAICETGRFKEYQGYDRLHKDFIRQLEHTTLETISGPERTIRWGVPDGERDASTGELIHDDLVISAALCAELDRQTWGTAESVTILPPDPLAGLGDVF